MRCAVGFVGILSQVFLPFLLIFPFFSTLLPRVPLKAASRAYLSHTDTAFYRSRAPCKRNCVSLANEKLIPDRENRQRQSEVPRFIIIKVSQLGYCLIYFRFRILTPRHRPVSASVSMLLCCRLLSPGTFQIQWIAEMSQILSQT